MIHSDKNFTSAVWSAIDEEWVIFPLHSDWANALGIGKLLIHPGTTV